MKKAEWKRKCVALEERLAMCRELHQKVMAEKAELNRCYMVLRNELMDRIGA